MPAALAAAHVGHEIEHTKAMWGFIAGAVVGLAVGVAVVAAVVVTGGAALAVVAAVGGAIASTGGMALAGKYIGEGYKNPSGPISTGSANVKFGPARMPAARSALDLVACKNHGPKMIALGSDSVFINTFPSARKDDKTECDGTVGSLMDHIFIGAETAQYLEIESEVPDWMVQIAQGMVIVGTAVALVFGAAAAAVAGGICGLISFAGTTVGGLAGGYLGAIGGGAIGEAIGGDIGRRWGETIGGLVGGAFGARLGNRATTGHPVDVATGEVFTSEVDFTIPGLIPIIWERFWISGSTQNGQLGHKWHHPYDVAMTIGTDEAVLRLEHGRLVRIPVLQPEERFYHRAEKLTVIREKSGGFTIQTEAKDRLTLVENPLEPSQYQLDTLGDFNGNHLQLTYTDTRHLQKITNCAGIELHFDLDTQGRITQVSKSSQDLTQPLMQYRYEDGALTAAINASGTPFSYAYEARLLVSETRRSGLSFYFAWDDVSLGRHAKCVKTWGQDNVYYREITYDQDDRSAQVIDSHGHLTVYYANTIGLIYKLITPSGYEVRQTYNVYAELEKVTDPEGHSAVTVFDDFGRVTSFVDKDKAATAYAYVSDNPESRNFHSVAQETNPLGHKTALEFDANGNLMSLRDPVSNAVSFLRNERGLPLAIRDDTGTLARFRWTDHGALLEERSAKGGALSYEYDVFDRIAAEKVDQDAPTKFTYDQLDQVTVVTHADGATTNLAYDIEGHVTQFTDRAGQTTHWHFGKCPLPLRRTNPDGSVFAYAYDAELNLVELRNEVHEVYQLAYDKEGHLVREVGFDGRDQSFVYDRAGNVIKAIDGHRAHDYRRDPLGRLLARHSTDGTQASYVYDAAGQMTVANNASRKLAFDYDPRGLLVAETQDGLTVTHSYDTRGQRTATALPDGRYVKFGYDQDGGFDALSFLDRTLIDIRRDRIGREKERQSAGIVQSTDYDPQGRIKAQQAHKTGQKNPIFGRAYDYNATGLISEIRDVARGVRKYQYDGREQLRAVTGDQSEAFAFDPAGNILGDVANPRDVSVKGGRLLMQGDNHFQYDDAGNRIRMERGWGGLNAFDYAYDDQNQLVSVVEKTHGKLKTTKFAYDALGRRVSKSYLETKQDRSAANDVASPDDAPEDNILKDEVTWFLWNGDVLLAEGTGTQSGAADPLALVYIYEPNSFRPAAQIRRTTPDDTGEAYVYWLDHLGTPQEITNEAGELVWQVALKAWGGVDRVHVEHVGNALRFQGQYHDVETGLHYSRFRHYDPAVGCFVNQDPIGLAGGEVNSAYAPNPIEWIDPFGLNRWNDYLRNNPGQTPQQAAANYNRMYPPPTPGPSIHGNARLSPKPAVLYAQVDQHGNFQKWGITDKVSNPTSRYGSKLPKGWDVYPVGSGSRSSMLDLERHLSERQPGQANLERWAGTKTGQPLNAEAQKAKNNAISRGCRF